MMGCTCDLSVCLGPELEAAVAKAVNMVEARGCMPESMQAFLVVLIPKAKPGFRTIALMPALYRLWARIRGRHMREWEMRNLSKRLLYQRGGSCIDAVWRQAVVAEAASAGQAYTCSFLWDMSSFFDFLDRGLLVGRAVASGMPTTLLQVSLCMYQSMRAMELEGGRPNYRVLREGRAGGVWIRLLDDPGLQWT